ncbi:MAG: hypothetical protein IKZ91_00685 [Bacteroidales bacterium]|nr:hypothetical protein [Bacteroidales bacterium]
MLVSALCFPASYDWQADTAFGRVSCTLKLFRGDEEALSIPAGPGTGVSASPDGHHIIEGSLYTVYSDASGTVIGREGRELARWPERELISGILPADGVLHSLGYNPSSGILNYRINGRVAWSGPGEQFGGFGADTYGPSGALYPDDGAVCFAYRQLSPDGTVVFVSNGQAEESAALPAGATVLDAKTINGRHAVLYTQKMKNYIIMDGEPRLVNPLGGFCWTEAGLIEYGSGIAVCGRGKLLAGSDYRWCAGNGQTLFQMLGRPDFVYQDGDSFVPVDLSSDLFDSNIFLRRSCACLWDGQLAVALTPRNGSNPFVQYGGKRTEYRICGFLTGVAFRID